MTTSIIHEILSGNRLALSRFLTKVENDSSLVINELNELYKYSGKAHRIGVTGASGTGKSSILNKLVRFLRDPGNDKLPLKIGIIAVDPSSPFTGGAILGDRIRMRELAGDQGVFIRSIATRGMLGGLAASTSAMAQVMDAAGYDLIFIETVGAGQSEVDIAHLAHTTIVVEAPGMGDDIQAIKAGIMEIADIFVINKADLVGVEEAERAIKANLQFSFAKIKKGANLEKLFSDPSLAVQWRPPIVRTVATSGSGIEELWEKISRHQEFLHDSKLWDAIETRRVFNELRMIIRDDLFQRWELNFPEEKFNELVADVNARKLSPWQAKDLVLKG